MVSSLTWRPLPLPASSGAPDLLVSIQIGTADYTVRITDMANTWVETLDRKAICMRAWGENTTIDPSDTPENMATFLSTIRSALDPTHPAYHKTSVIISAASPTDAGEDGLTLRATCILPGLQPLEWPFHLRKSSASATAECLVLPLIQAQYSRACEINSLVDMMNQKDAVISKLVDKLGATGTGLEHVFTSLFGRKKVSREDAYMQVKGLAPFDRHDWKWTMDHQPGPESTGLLVQSVFGSDSLQTQDSMDARDLSRLNRWWLGLQGTFRVSHQDLHLEARRQPGSTADSPGSTAGDEDEFQVQEMTPNLTSKGFNSQDMDDMSTESDADGSTPPHQPPQHNLSCLNNQEVPSKAPALRVGMIGGKKKLQPKQESTLNKKCDDHPEGDLETTRADDNPESDGQGGAKSVLQVATLTPEKATSPRRGTIGRVGQKSSQIDTEKPDSVTIGVPDTDTPRLPRLGTIGQRKESKVQYSTVTGHGDGIDRGRSAGRESAENRETSTERADRRREELKQELEKKAMAGPSKKKRKF